MRKTPAQSRAESILRQWVLFLFVSSSVIVLTVLASAARSSVARTVLDVLLGWFPGLLTVGGIVVFVFAWRALPGTLPAFIEKVDPATGQQPPLSFGIHTPFEVLAVVVTYGSLAMLTIFYTPVLASCRGCHTVSGFETLLGLDALGWAGYLFAGQVLWLLVAILD